MTRSEPSLRGRKQVDIGKSPRPHDELLVVKHLDLVVSGSMHFPVISSGTRARPASLSLASQAKVTQSIRAFCGRSTTGASTPRNMPTPCSQNHVTTVPIPLKGTPYQLSHNAPSHAPSGPSVEKLATRHVPSPTQRGLRFTQNTKHTRYRACCHRTPPIHAPTARTHATSSTSEQLDHTCAVASQSHRQPST